MAINSKSKGNRTEREFAKILSDRFNMEFKRTPMSGAWGTFNRDQEVREDAKEILSGDIICPPKFIFSIECKSRQEFNFWDLLNEDVQHLEIDDWIWQAEQDASASSKEPKITYGKYVIMRFDYFLKKDTSFFFRSNVLT